MAEHPESPTPRRRGFGLETVFAGMNSLGTAWIFILLVIVNLDIGGRALFNHPIRGVPEVVAMSITALVFLQIAHTIGVGRLTRSDALIGWLMRTRPRAGHALEALYSMVGAVLFGILLRYSWPLFSKAWAISEYVGAEGDFKAPTWPVKLVVVIGCAAGVLQFLLMAWRHARAAATGREPGAPGTDS